MSPKTRSSMLAPIVGVMVGIVASLVVMQTSMTPSTLRGDIRPYDLPQGPAGPGQFCRFTVQCENDADCSDNNLGNCLCQKDAEGYCVNNGVGFCNIFHQIDCVEGENCVPGLEGMVCSTNTIPKQCGTLKLENACADGVGCNEDQTCQYVTTGTTPTCACVGPVSDYGPVDDNASCLKAIPCLTTKQCEDAGLGTCVRNPTFNGITEIGYFCTERDELECKHSWAHCTDSSNGGKYCKPDPLCGNASKEGDEECDPGGICIDGTEGGTTINGSQAYARCVDGGGGVSVIATSTCTEECKGVASSASSSSEAAWCCNTATYTCNPISGGGGPTPNF